MEGSAMALLLKYAIKRDGTEFLDEDGRYVTDPNKARLFRSKGGAACARYHQDSRNYRFGSGNPHERRTYEVVGMATSAREIELR
jgi:hypothetical protein